MKKVVFMGTPDFAVPALEALIRSDDYEVALVICQPDKPQGRKQILTAPPVKALAVSHGVEVYQPNTLKTDEAYEKIAACAPDFIVVSAYGKILPKSILDLPRYGCVNLHGSLLPKYRGAAPVQWSVINGDAVSGVTTMLMDVGLDTGDMLLRETVAIGPEESAGELFDRLAALCPALLLRTLRGLENGAITPEKQNEAQATYVGMLDKSMAEIDWTKDAQTIHDLIRGLDPWPVAKTKYDGKIFKIYSSRVCGHSIAGECGAMTAENGRLFVRCGDGALELLEVQLEGAKRMSAADFLRGHSVGTGFPLG
ncbi:MAG: methionyl-tRNA formyltransferase [Clostridia bacterium]|nr:methionyl-tRNA formyltransferase [Clostridia bacterium]